MTRSMPPRTRGRSGRYAQDLHGRIVVQATLMTPGPQFAASNSTRLMDFSALSWLYAK